jgi:hypothetical protein
MIGSNGFKIPEKPWEHLPPKVNKDTYKHLTDNEIESLTYEEMLSIGRSLWKRLPFSDTMKLASSIIRMKNKSEIKPKKILEKDAWDNYWKNNPDKIMADCSRPKEVIDYINKNQKNG